MVVQIVELHDDDAIFVENTTHPEALRQILLEVADIKERNPDYIPVITVEGRFDAVVLRRAKTHASRQD